jgi:hypothetical protein
MTSPHYELFAHMSQAHGLILTDDELEEIVDAVKRCKQNAHDSILTDEEYQDFVDAVRRCEPGADGYTAAEHNCQSCTGPCGQCEAEPGKGQENLPGLNSHQGAGFSRLS